MNIINYLDERWLIDLCEIASKDPDSLIGYLDLIDEIRNQCGRSSITYSQNLLETKCGDDLLCEVIWGELGRVPDLRDSIQRILRLISESDTFETDPNRDNKYKSDAHSALHKSESGGLIYKEKEDLEWWDDNSMILVDNSDKIKNLYRILSIYNNISYEKFPEYLGNGFPNIFFLDNAKDFSKACIAEKHDNGLNLVIKHLSYLNDFAQKDYLANPEQFEQKAHGHEVTLSRESTSTKGNASAIKERTRKVGDDDLFFELHTKLYRDRGRIHFHIGTNLDKKMATLTKGRLIVGIVCKHLST